MKLAEALNLIRTPAPAAAAGFTTMLATGFEPLHLKVFLAAELGTRMPGRRVEILGGAYGNLAGSLEQGLRGGAAAIAVVVEWPDLDPRLGARSLGGWQPSLLPDLVQEVERRTSRLLAILQGLAPGGPVVVALPTLPMLPAFYHPGRQTGAVELELRATLARFAAELARRPRVRILGAQSLDLLSPPAGRHDLRAELGTGFPYRLAHASALAALLADNLAPAAPRKGLVTDLDDTLWRGLLGEEGVRGVSWDLDHRSQMHALYQQFLASLAEAGVLLGVASKNDPELAEAALGREDMGLPRTSLFPVKAGWEPKPGSMAEILRAWNLGPADVVYIDDSPMELAQMAAAYPAMTCLEFPTRDEPGVLDLLRRLRDLFGKETLLEEDRLRTESLKRADWMGAGAGDGDQLEGLLREARAELVVDFATGPADLRAFELINKTNQFNLNGRRLAEARWAETLAEPGAFLMTVAYADKYGPLGKIAVVLGRSGPGGVRIHSWVMSCRAFSRRIEYQCLNILFIKFAGAPLSLDWVKTDRNQPIQLFIESFQPTLEPEAVILSNENFIKICPMLYHRVKDLPHG